MTKYSPPVISPAGSNELGVKARNGGDATEAGHHHLSGGANRTLFQFPQSSMDVHMQASNTENPSLLSIFIVFPFLLRNIQRSTSGCPDKTVFAESLIKGCLRIFSYYIPIDISFNSQSDCFSSQLFI